MLAEEGKRTVHRLILTGCFDGAAREALYAPPPDSLRSG